MTCRTVTCWSHIQREWSRPCQITLTGRYIDLLIYGPRFFYTSITIVLSTNATLELLQPGDPIKLAKLSLYMTLDDVPFAAIHSIFWSGKRFKELYITV